MLLAIVLSFMHSLYIVARPYCVELARVPGSTVWWPPSRVEHGEHEAGVLVFAPAAPLNFTNAERICATIDAALAAKRPPVKLLVIEASGIIDIDYTGAKILQQAIADLGRARHRRRDRPAVGQARPGPGRPLGPDRGDRRGPRLHVGRGRGAEAGTQSIAARD